MDDRTVIEWDKDDLERSWNSQGGCARPWNADVSASQFRSPAFPLWPSARPLVLQEGRRRGLQHDVSAPTRSACSRSKVARRCRCCRACGRRNFMISSLKSRSFVRDPFKAKWFILICGEEKSFAMRIEPEYPAPCLRSGTRMIEECPQQNDWRAAVSGTSHAACDRCGEIHAWRKRIDCVVPWRRSSASGTIQFFEKKFHRWHEQPGLRPRTSRFDCFDQIKGFGSYGFPESHAASFANSRLCLGLDQMPLPRCVRGGAAEQPADGILRDVTDSCAMPRSTASKSGRWISIDPTGIARLKRAPLERTLHPRHHVMKDDIRLNACSPSRPSPDRRILRGLGQEHRKRPRPRLRLRPRSLAAHASAAEGAGNARPRRCLQFARAQPPRCALGREGASPRRRQGRPAAVRARHHAGAGARRASAVDAAGRAGDRGLSPSAPVPEGASGVVPARRSRCARHRAPRAASHAHAGPARHHRRHGAGAAAARHRQRHLHDARGRDRDRQHHRLAAQVRRVSSDGDGRAADQRDRRSCKTKRTSSTSSPIISRI